MWILLLGTVIIASLAIWGCTVLIETPAQEKVTSEVSYSYHNFTSYNQIQ
jgi:hypothetical protein